MRRIVAPVSIRPNISLSSYMSGPCRCNLALVLLFLSLTPYGPGCPQHLRALSPGSRSEPFCRELVGHLCRYRQPLEITYSGRAPAALGTTLSARLQTVAPPPSKHPYLNQLPFHVFLRTKVDLCQHTRSTCTIVLFVAASCLSSRCLFSVNFGIERQR